MRTHTSKLLAVLGAAVSIAACSDPGYLVASDGSRYGIVKGGNGGGLACGSECTIGNGAGAPVQGSDAGASKPAEDGATASPPDSIPAQGCSTQKQGGATSCKDVGIWKEYAWEACKESGLEMTDYKPAESCGDQSYRYVEYTCCKPSQPSTPDPAPSCVVQKEGDATSCKDVAVWKEYAWEACKESGLEMTDYKPAESCGDQSYRYVEYTCCKPSQPSTPDPAPSCSVYKEGDRTTCKDVDTWKQYTSEACRTLGLGMNEYKLAESCGDQSYRYVQYACCPPSQPTPPPSCSPGKDGSSTSCKDVDTWKLYASEACQQLGLQLGEYAPVESCGTDRYRYVEYTCCKG